MWRSVISRWRPEVKYPWLDYYATLQDVLPVVNIRPLATPLLARNVDTVAAATNTPYYQASANWQPNPPHRTTQILRNGGVQEGAPTVAMIQQMHVGLARNGSL